MTVVHFADVHLVHATESFRVLYAGRHTVYAVVNVHCQKDGISERHDVSMLEERICRISMSRSDMTMLLR